MMRTKKLVVMLVALIFSASLAMAMSHAKKDIVETAVEAGSFNTLTAALTAANMVSTLKGEGPFTVFAPTDEAFDKLPPGTLENLLKPENKSQLQAILTYHVVPGMMMASDVSKIQEAKTVNGGDLMVKEDMGKVMINDAQVIKADIECSNGIIHVVDTVIIPEQ